MTKGGEDLKEVVQVVGKQLAKNLLDSMDKCFDLGVIDERKRLVEKAKNIRKTVDSSPALDQFIAEVEKELKDFAK